MEEEIFNFRGDQLPTNSEVFSFINSRTKYGKTCKETALNEAAKKIHDIWKKADACPLGKAAIKLKCENLLTGRKNFFRQEKPITPESDSQLSEYTRKRRLPSTSRERSKRPSTSIYKIQPCLNEEVQSVLDHIIDTVIAEEAHENAFIRPRRMALRNDFSPEMKWQMEIGCLLFDVFSIKAQQKALKEDQAFDEEFLADQRSDRKLFMDTSEVTEEFEMMEAQKKERKRRQLNNLLSATNAPSFHQYQEETGENDTSELFQDKSVEVSSEQFHSSVRTRAAHNQELASVQKGNSRSSVGTQTEADAFFPEISTRITSKDHKTSTRLNPRLLAAGSLMMGVAGVTTRQAIICIKIVANTLFQQNYVLPPSLEKDYQKKMKLRRKLAKMDSAGSSSNMPQEVEDTRQAVANVIAIQEQQDSQDTGSFVEPQPLNHEDHDDQFDATDFVQVEERALSACGRKELLKRMLCKPSSLRTAHHLISTLGEQQQALEMIENQNVNLIPDGTARQGGWGKMAGAVLKIGEKHRALRLQTLGCETHSSWVETIAHMIRRLSLASGQDVSRIWQAILVLVSDMCKVNMNLAQDVALQLGCSWQPGQAFCNLHPRLMMSRSIVDIWKRHQSRIGHDKIFPSLEYCNLDATNESLVKQVLDALMSLSSKQWAERSWNKFHEITEWMGRRGIANETGPLREIRFGELEAKALTGAYHLTHIEQFLEIHTEIRNKLTCFLRSVFPMRELLLFYWIGAALIGIHVGEPYVNLLMVKKAKTTELIKTIPQLHKELLDPPKDFTQLEGPAIPCLGGAWIDPMDEIDPPYPKTQIQFLSEYLKETERKYLELFCREVAEQIAIGLKRQKGDVFGFGDGSQPQLNICSQVPEEKLDSVETTSISVEQFFGEVDYKTKVSGGCQAKNKICDDLVIKHTEDLIQKQLTKSNYSLKPMKNIVKEVDSLQFQFDQRQKSLMAAGLREDEAVVLSKESQVQRVVRQCKESHGGPVMSVKELENLILAKQTEKELASALNLEIRYRKFTCLLKVATNNELFKQQGIDNKLRITHLKQLLTDDTRPKCHASLQDVESLYDQALTPTQVLEVSPEEGIDSDNRADWFMNRCWPPCVQEQVVVLTNDTFCLATIEKCHDESAEATFMKSLKVRNHPPLAHWVMDDSASKGFIQKESVLHIRPILEVRGHRKTSKFFLSNLDVIQQFIESLKLQ